MTINDVELELDIYDADTAVQYEKAIQALQNTPKATEDQKLSETIRIQCQAIFNFFNILFGEGTDLKIFGACTNLNSCLDAAEQVILSVRAQKNRLSGRIDDYHNGCVQQP